jgi:hypothetical protein
MFIKDYIEKVENWDEFSLKMELELMESKKDYEKVVILMALLKKLELENKKVLDKS